METIGFNAAIAAQPAALHTALATVRAGLTGLPPAFADPAAAGRVFAMGASIHAASALTAVAARHGRHIAATVASEASPGDAEADWYLAISESGRSPEPLAALAGRHPNAALTNVPDSPVARVADAVLSLGDVPDAGVYVTGYTATVAALGLLGAHVGIPGAADGLDELPHAVAELLANGPASLDRVATLSPRAVESVGSGVSLAAAAELALLVREAARTPGAAHAPGTFIHGPAESLEPTDLLVVWGTDVAGLAARFAADVPTLTVSAAPDADLRLPDLPPLATAVLEGVAAQLITAGLAGRGFEVGQFRYAFDDTKLDA